MNRDIRELIQKQNANGCFGYTFIVMNVLDSHCKAFMIRLSKALIILEPCKCDNTCFI